MNLRARRSFNAYLLHRIYQNYLLNRESYDSLERDHPRINMAMPVLRRLERKGYITVMLKNDRYYCRITEKGIVRVKSSVILPTFKLPRVGLNRL